MVQVETNQHPDQWRGPRYDPGSISWALRELAALDSLIERLARTSDQQWGYASAYEAGRVLGFTGHLAAAYAADEYDEHALRCVFAHRWAPLEDAQAVVDTALAAGESPRATVLAWLSRLRPIEHRKAA